MKINCYNKFELSSSTREQIRSQKLWLRKIVRSMSITVQRHLT